jgi:hypothetical protein
MHAQWPPGLCFVGRETHSSGICSCWCGCILPFLVQFLDYEDDTAVRYLGTLDVGSDQYELWVIFRYEHSIANVTNNRRVLLLDVAFFNPKTVHFEDAVQSPGWVFQKLQLRGRNSVFWILWAGSSIFSMWENKFHTTMALSQSENLKLPFLKTSWGTPH